MTIDAKQLALAERRMPALEKVYALVSARYQRMTRRLVLELVTGIQISVPVDRIQGLAHARASELSELEISPSGLGVHWPKLDADVHVPALAQGRLGSEKWMASLLEADHNPSRGLFRAGH